MICGIHHSIINRTLNIFELKLNFFIIFIIMLALQKLKMYEINYTYS